MPVLLKEIADDLTVAASRRLSARHKMIDQANRYAARGELSPHVSDKRKNLYVDRETSLSNEASLDTALAQRVGHEATIDKTDEILSIEFLEAGQLAARPVGRITVMNGVRHGTGFLVGEGLLITNHHVLENQEIARNSVVEFNFEEQKFGEKNPVSEFLLEPERFWLTDEDFDFTLVAVNAQSMAGVEIGAFGWHPLLGEGKILEGQPINVIQHPEGGFKSIALHNSHFLLVENDGDVDRYCWYTGDTKRGSSGAPVFNKHWDVVALHHKAVPRTNKNNEILDIHGKTMKPNRYEEFPELVAHVANEGIRASRLVARLGALVPPNPQHIELKEQLLNLWKGQAARFLRLRIPG